MRDRARLPKLPASAAPRQAVAASEREGTSPARRGEPMWSAGPLARPMPLAAPGSAQAQRDGSPRMLLQRRQLLQAFGTSAPVQRVKTPGLPEELPEGLDLQAFFRNHLFTLKWQLATQRLRDSPEMQEVDRQLALAERGEPLIRGDLEALIASVELATPSAKATTPTREETLSPEEIVVLKGLLSEAAQLADHLSRDLSVLAEVFGNSAAAAAKNFGLIKVHLESWRADPQTRATIDRTSTGFGAFNVGVDDKSKLTLTPRFATDERASVLRTLIHEASHGKVGTKDLAYLSAPYFLKVTDSLALNNADHYAYAALRHGGSPALLPVAEAAVPTVEQAFQRATNVCVFRCQRVWPVMKYLIDKYEGLQRSVQPDTFDANEDAMGLGGRTGRLGDDPTSWRPFLKPQVRLLSPLAPALLPICKESSRMFEEVLGTLTQFLQRPHELVAVQGGETELRPIGGGGWPKVRFRVDVAQDVLALAEHIFVTSLTHFTFNEWQASRLFAWSEAMFANIMKDVEHREAGQVSPEMLALEKILLGR